MGASRARILRSVVVPAIAPYIFAGFRIALPIALIVVIITEMISSADGLGYLAMYALASFKTDRMLAIVVVIALIGVALDRLAVRLRDRLVFWERLAPAPRAPAVYFGRYPRSTISSTLTGLSSQPSLSRMKAASFRRLER